MPLKACPCRSVPMPLGDIKNTCHIMPHPCGDRYHCHTQQSPEIHDCCLWALPEKCHIVVHTPCYHHSSNNNATQGMPMPLGDGRDGCHSMPCLHSNGCCYFIWNDATAGSGCCQKHVVSLFMCLVTMTAATKMWECAPCHWVTLEADGMACPCDCARDTLCCCPHILSPSLQPQQCHPRHALVEVCPMPLGDAKGRCHSVSYPHDDGLCSTVPKTIGSGCCQRYVVSLSMHLVTTTAIMMPPKACPCQSMPHASGRHPEADAMLHAVYTPPSWPQETCTWWHMPPLYNKYLPHMTSSSLDALARLAAGCTQMTICGSDYRSHPVRFLAFQTWQLDKNDVLEVPESNLTGLNPPKAGLSFRTFDWQLVLTGFEKGLIFPWESCLGPVSQNVVPTLGFL